MKPQQTQWIRRFAIVGTNQHNRTQHNKTKQNKTKQNTTQQNRTKQNKSKQNKTKQNKTKQITDLISDVNLTLVLVPLEVFRGSKRKQKETKATKATSKK